MYSAPKQTRILALDLGSKEMGYALFEGDILVRYGVRNFKKNLEGQNKEALPGIDLIKTYRPGVVIIGKLSHPERMGNPKLKRLANLIIRFAQKQGTMVHEIEPKTATKYLIKDRKPTKMNAVALIAAIYPELSVYVPQKRRILWTQKDMYWMNMFDALTLALVYVRKRIRGKDRSTYLTIKSKTI